MSVSEVPHDSHPLQGHEAVVQAACLESWRSEKQNVSSPLTRKDSILWSLRDREVACSAPDLQDSNSVSGGQCHLIYLTIPRRFSWPSLAYMCTKVKGGLKPCSFHFAKEKS